MKAINNCVTKLPVKLLPRVSLNCQESYHQLCHQTAKVSEAFLATQLAGLRRKGKQNTLPGIVLRCSLYSVQTKHPKDQMYCTLWRVKIVKALKIFSSQKIDLKTGPTN